MQFIKKIFFLVLLSTSAFFIIQKLYKKSSDTEILKRNGFERFFTGNIRDLKTITLTSRTNELIAIEDTTISILNESMKDITQVSTVGNYLKNIPISIFETCHPERFHNVSINNPLITVFDTKTKSISSKDISNSKDTGTCIILKNSLIRGIRISNTAILRALDTSNKYPIFLNVNIITKSIMWEQAITEKVLDGALSNDGIFIPVDSTKVIYLYHHKNIYKCYDTSLNLLFTHHTIDTSTTSPKIKNLPMGGYAFSEPVRVKNMRGCVNDRILYVNSSLIAENEKRDEFRSNSVIDRYDLQSGKYLGSFYIPVLYGERINDFKIKGDKLFALYKKNLKIFKIH